MDLKKVRKATVVIILCSGVSVASFYIIFFFIPKIQLSAVLSEFEDAAREKDYKKLHSIFSKESPHYEKLESKNLQVLFNKFEKGIIVRNARLIPFSEVEGNRANIIWGNAKMTAKIDGEERYFYDIFLVKESGDWKIRQFGFPDLVDY